MDPSDIDAAPATRTDAHENVDRIYVLTDISYHNLSGPFPATIDGWQFEVALSTEPDDYGTISEIDQQLIKNAPDDAMLLAVFSDGAVAAYGEITSVDHVEDTLLVAAQFLGSPDQTKENGDE